MKCRNCDEEGFCAKYSNGSVVWKCEKQSVCAGFEKAPLEYPWKNCTRVKAPVYCMDKSCEDWRKWFIERWEAFNNYAKKHLKEEGRAEDA